MLKKDEPLSSFFSQVSQIDYPWVYVVILCITRLNEGLEIGSNRSNTSRIIIKLPNFLSSKFDELSLLGGGSDRWIW